MESWFLIPLFHRLGLGLAGPPFMESGFIIPVVRMLGLRLRRGHLFGRWCAAGRLFACKVEFIIITMAG